jgi:hypothetical protein
MHRPDAEAGVTKPIETGRDDAQSAQRPVSEQLDTPAEVDVETGPRDPSGSPNSGTDRDLEAAQTAWGARRSPVGVVNRELVVILLVALIVGVAVTAVTAIAGVR